MDSGYFTFELLVVAVSLRKTALSVLMEDMVVLESCYTRMRPFLDALIHK